MKHVFKTERLSERVTSISGLAGELCYLIEGDQEALLIDGLTGVGSLKTYLQQLTALPVKLALTHGHLDHTGAAWEYGSCFIHPADLPLMYSSEHSGQEERLRYVLSRADRGAGGDLPTMEDVIPAHPIETIPLREGACFDLGGVCLEAIHVPGHTPGSLVFLDKGSRTLFSGDACNAYTLLAIPGGCTVEVYRDSLLHLKNWQQDFDVLYGGHNPNPVPNRIIDDAISLCDRILAGTDDACHVKTPLGMEGYFAAERGADGLPKDGSYANIFYARDHIFGGWRPYVCQRL